MDTSFIYTQKRKEFGKPCNFTDVGPHLLVDIDPDPELKKEFYVMPTLSRGVDCSIKMCAHEVNTDSCTTEARGMNHVEGGWPAGVDITDEDSTSRFRKKVEKDKGYVHTVKTLAELIENLVMENNSLDVYENYYGGEVIYSEKDSEPFTTLNVFQDRRTNPRRIVDLSWSYDSSKIAAAYSDEGIVHSYGDTSMDSYIWDLHDTVSPLVVLNPEVSLNCLEFSIREPHLIIGGFRNGQVGIWDIRNGNTERAVSSVLTSHSQKVTGIKWLESSTNKTFLSTSIDGSAMNWDLRDLSQPIEALYLDPEIQYVANLAEKYTISCLEYDPTYPDKFMFGTEQGHILSFNRRCESDDPLTTFRWNQSPISKLERNSYFPNLFGSCNPWTVSIWSDFSDDFTVLNIDSRNGQFTDFTWSQTRPSMLFLSKTTGVLEVWDVPGKHSLPLKTIQVAKDPLLSISSDYTGDRIVCGTVNGTIYLLEISDFLKKCSDLEVKLVKSMVVSDVDIGEGLPRCDRLKRVDKEPWAAPASIRKEKPLSFRDMYDPPETAEELYEENMRLFKDFPKIVVDEDNSALIRKYSEEKRMFRRMERKLKTQRKDVSRVVESMVKLVEKEEEEVGESQEDLSEVVDDTAEDALEEEEVKEEVIVKTEEELLEIDYDAEDTMDSMLDAMEDESRDRLKVEKHLEYMLNTYEDASGDLPKVQQTVEFMLDILEEGSKERLALPEDGLTKELASDDGNASETDKKVDDLGNEDDVPPNEDLGENDNGDEANSLDDSDKVSDTTGAEEKTTDDGE